MIPKTPRRPRQGGGGGTSHGLINQGESSARLAEVADRLRVIALLTDLQNMPDLTIAERMSGINSLTMWARIHLAVAREHGEAA